MSERYRNKRVLHRKGGRFAKLSAADVGIGGTCPTPGCNHFLLRFYDGDPQDAFPDPRKFRMRCWTCEPETEQEAERNKPAPQESLSAFFERAMGEGEV